MCVCEHMHCKCSRCLCRIIYAPNSVMTFYVISLSPHRHPHHEQTNETTAQAKPTDEENDQISPEASDQSAIERAVRDITTSGRKRETSLRA